MYKGRKYRELSSCPFPGTHSNAFLLFCPQLIVSLKMTEYNGASILVNPLIPCLDSNPLEFVRVADADDYEALDRATKDAQPPFAT